MLTHSQQQFLELVKTGLWGTPFDINPFEKQRIDWDVILSLCDQQTVTGIVSDALSVMPQTLRPPKNKYFIFIKKTGEIEDENIKLYDVIPNIVCEFEKIGIKAIVLKGQGVGLCYRNPYRRTSGDIDFFIGFKWEDYENAKKKIAEFGGKVGEKTKDYRRHADFILKDTIVELHGDIQLTVSRTFDCHFRFWMEECFAKEACIIKKSGNQVIYLPPYRFDAIFVFAHAMNHYMTSGVGIRQICDWMCYLAKNHGKIDVPQLEKDLDELGLTKFWKMFASMAVHRLGMKKELMPLYDDTFQGKDERLLHHIFTTGNFGYLQRQKQLVGGNRILKKLKTFYGQLYVYWDNLWVFPLETLYCFKCFVTKGIRNI